jgi:hypothetical protein
MVIDSHLHGNDREDMDSRSPIRSRTGFTGMTPVKQGFTGQVLEIRGFDKSNILVDRVRTQVILSATPSYVFYFLSLS